MLCFKLIYYKYMVFKLKVYYQFSIGTSNQTIGAGVVVSSLFKQPNVLGQRAVASSRCKDADPLLPIAYPARFFEPLDLH